MALDVYFREDIGCATAAALVLVLKQHLAYGEYNREWLAGAYAMAQAQATVFGVPWSLVNAQVQDALEFDVMALLEKSKELENGSR